MASIRVNKLKNGESYTLMWRVNGKAEAQNFKTRAEAEMWQKLIQDNGNSIVRAQAMRDADKMDGPTLAEMMTTHISELTDVGPYMLKRYTKAIDNHFASIGRRKVKSIEHEDIVEWIKYMQSKGLSAKTIANQHGFLSATMTTAVRKKVRPANPCKGVKLPKDTSTEDPIRFIEKEEWQRILEHMDPHFVPFFQFLIGTGLRFGEATALTPKDFKLRGRVPTVKITKAWKDDGEGGYYIGPPKTKRSRRPVSLAPSTLAAILPALEAAGDGYVFTLKRGGVMRSGSTFNRAWDPALKAAGIPKEERPRIHDCRHTHASWMIAAGMEIFALSRRLGHESITTTMDRYSHLLPDAEFTGSSIAQKALEA